MPRSGINGTYTLPGPQATQAPLTPIPSAVNNAGWSDVEQTFNTVQPEAYGGTGASTFAQARTNLGLVIGTNVAPILKGHLYGLTLSNNVTDATNDIDIAVGQASTDAASPTMMTLAATLTKRLDAAWAVGNNNGGLDTGSIANTTYHVWLIQRSDTGVVDALFSASATSPAMPTNYDRKRRIGSIIRSSGAILQFSQYGNEFLLVSPVLDVSATNPGTSAVSRTLSVPTGVVVHVIFNGGAVNTGTTNSTVLFSELAAADSGPSESGGALATGGLLRLSTGGLRSDSNRFTMRTNTSGQIRSRLSGSDANITLYIATLGWVDERGRD